MAGSTTSTARSSRCWPSPRQPDLPDGLARRLSGVRARRARVRLHGAARREAGVSGVRRLSLSGRHQAGRVLAHLRVQLVAGLRELDRPGAHLVPAQRRDDVGRRRYRVEGRDQRAPGVLRRSPGRQLGADPQRPKRVLGGYGNDVATMHSPNIVQSLDGQGLVNLSDKRRCMRRQAWDGAVEVRLFLNAEEARILAVNVVLGTVFFSVWMAVFHDDDLCRRPVDTFPGTRTE